MSAADHVHPVQLQMFMPARDLYGMHSMDTAGFGGDVGAMRASKRKTNAAGGMERSIAALGVRKPVQVFHGEAPEAARFMGEHAMAVANGNHRVTAAYDVDPGMEVPVVHHDQFGDLIGGMRDQDTSSW